jgi:Phospholipid methyltransferase
MTNTKSCYIFKPDNYDVLMNFFLLAQVELSNLNTRFRRKKGEGNAAFASCHDKSSSRRALVSKFFRCRADARRNRYRVRGGLRLGHQHTARRLPRSCLLRLFQLGREGAFSRHWRDAAGHETDRRRKPARLSQFPLAAAPWRRVLAYRGAALRPRALWLFVWTIRATRSTPPTLAFATDAPAILFCHGPYRYVRHPFYLSYILFWIGTAVSAAGPGTWAVPLVMGALYFQGASREERKFARSALGAGL